MAHSLLNHSRPSVVIFYYVIYKLPSGIILAEQSKAINVEFEKAA